MKALAYLVSLTIALCGLMSIELPASATASDITGTWQVTLHTPDAGDIPATYVLKQDGEKISGTYDGRGGRGEITGTLKGTEITLIVTVPDQRTGRLSGKLTAGTKMSGTVSGWNSNGDMPWSAEKKTKDIGTLSIVNQYGGGIYYVAVQPGSGGGPVKVPAGAKPAKGIEEGKPSGTTAVIADGASKSYSLEEGSYHVLLNFYKPGSGAFTGTERTRPILITAGQTRTLTITADGTLKY